MRSSTPWAGHRSRWPNVSTPILAIGIAGLVPPEIPAGRNRTRSVRFLSLIFLGLFAFPTMAGSAAPSSQKFLLLSDLHFNSMADPSLVANLTAADASQWQRILDQSKLRRFSQYGEDTNWWLLRSALDQMRTRLPHPAFIMFTGDLLAHDFRTTFASVSHDNDQQHYRAFVIKTMQFMALQFRMRFPEAPILVTPGNNDEECGDYTIEANGGFLRDTADLARTIAEADSHFMSQWIALGSYNVPHPTIRGIRILSLNTTFLSNEYHPSDFSKGCAPTSSTAPEDLFTWFEANLKAAKQANEKVWLMFHIPPGIDGVATAHQYESLARGPAALTMDDACSQAIVPMLAPKWNQRFQRLLEEYKDTILASFAGHTHTDDFRLVGDGAFIIITPPISPVYRQNPAFRVVTFASDGRLLDQTTYMLANLEDATGNTHGVWNSEYHFSKRWKTPEINAANLELIYQRIESDDESRRQWLKFYNVASTAALVSAEEARALYCAIAFLDTESYSHCFCTAISSQNMPAQSHQTGRL